MRSRGFRYDLFRRHCDETIAEIGRRYSGCTLANGHDFMSERTYTAKLRGNDVKVTSRDLARFRDMFLGVLGMTEIANRMSELIWVDIYILNIEFGVSPHDVLNPIKNLEHGESPSGIKPATQFKNMPLKGLWHKHYFSAHFLVRNIILGLGKTGLEKLVNEVMDPAKAPVITQDMINELSRRVAREPIEIRDAHKKLTGEWIIFLRHREQNYYLCCTTHDAGDQSIYDQITEHCVRDFPHLLTWMKEEQQRLT